jgi:Ca2+-binding RTX toxin-like protein
VIPVARVVINGGNGADRLRGTMGVDEIRGGNGNDQIEGRDGHDYLFGGAGDDLLISNGPDHLDGGAGIDIARIIRSDSLNGLVLDLSAGDQTLADGTRLVSIERLQFTGGSGSDIVTGGALDDTLDGGAGADILRGGAGNDTLTGSTGDVLEGGAGDDRFEVSGAVARIDGGTGRDSVRVNADAVFAAGSLANVETVTVRAGANADFSRLDTGISVSVTDNAVRGSQLTGTAFADTLVGRNGNDVIVGGAGNDSIRGGDGDDVLSGGTGLDVMTGGRGADTFVFNALNEGLDRIEDFTLNVDQIDLRGLASQGLVDAVELVARGRDVLVIVEHDGVDHELALLRSVNLDQARTADLFL